MNRKKLQYIWDYYKFPILIAVVILYLLGRALYGHLTEKTVVLYTALINVEPKTDVVKHLTEDYLARSETDHPSRSNESKIYLYQNLYLSADETADPQYTAASRMKILAAIDAEEFDVILTSQEVMDAFAEKGYLCDLATLLPSDKLPDSSAWYRSADDSSNMIRGLRLSSDFFEAQQYSDDLYLGVIANTPRREEAARYLQYLIN